MSQACPSQLAQLSACVARGLQHQRLLATGQPRARQRAVARAHHAPRVGRHLRPRGRCRAALAPYTQCYPTLLRGMRRRVSQHF